MTHEPIDFSGREDEFLSGELKQQALAFAIITAVVGFVFSSWLFVNRRVGPAAEILDRRAAEGRVVTNNRGYSHDSSGSSGGFRAPRLRGSKRKKREERPGWKDLKVISSLSEATKKRKKKTSKKIAKTNLGDSPTYRRMSRATNVPSKLPVKIKPTDKEPNTDIDRLLFPKVENRPDRNNLRDVTNKVAGNIFFVGNRRGQSHVGVVLDSSGRALVHTNVATAGNLNRVWISGSQRSAVILSRDGEFGLSLVKVGGTFSALPLAPVPPAPGEKILGVTPAGKRPLGQVYRSGLAFGKAGFFVEGDFGSLGLGAPLFNDRGELLGLYIASLPGAPEPGLHLACDSSVIYRLMRGYRGGGTLRQTVDAAADRLARRLASLESEGESRRGRILPGTSLSDFHLGQRKQDIVGKLSSPEWSEFGSKFTSVTSPAPPVSLYFVQGRLALAETAHPGFATPEGLAQGSEATPRQLSRTYPELETFFELHIAPGLDILVDSKERVEKFVVRPDLSR